MATDIEMLARMSDLVADASSFVDDESLGEPTPCRDWNVGDLLDHIIGGNRFTVQVLQGQSAEAALVQVHESFAGADTTASGRIQALLDSNAAQHDALAGEGVVHGTYHHVAGKLSGEQIMRMRIHDVCIHMWDLLLAVNPTKGLDPVYVRWAIDELAKPDSLAARHMATGFPLPSKSYELLLAFGRRRSLRHLR